jgi:hypothetical protein
MDALEGTDSVELPDLKAIIQYIGLFTLVTIDPTEAARDSIPTEHLPNLSNVALNSSWLLLTLAPLLRTPRASLNH